MGLEDLSGHVVVCGWNRMGEKLLAELEADRELGQRSVVVVAELAEPPAPVAVPAERFYFLSADYTRVEVLEQAGVERASIALLLADKSKPRSDQDRDARTVLAALTIEKLNRDIFTCAELLRRENQTPLLMSGVEQIVVPDEYTGKILASASRTRGILSVLDQLLSSASDNKFWRARVPAAWVGKTAGFAHQILKDRFDAVFLSLERREGGACRARLNPPKDEPLQGGDELIFVAERFPAELAIPGDEKDLS